MFRATRRIAVATLGLVLLLANSAGAADKSWPREMSTPLMGS